MIVVSFDNFQYSHKLPVYVITQGFEDYIMKLVVSHFIAVQSQLREQN